MEKASAPFYVALVEGGIPKFSEKPVGHSTAPDALAEARRLASVHRGKTFQVFNSTLMTAVEEKRLTFTGRQLLSTAPDGEYVRVDEPFRQAAYTARNSVRFIVATRGTNRIVYVRSALNSVTPLNSSFAQGTSQFELVSLT